MATEPAPFLTALRLSDSFLPTGGYTSSYGLEQYLNEDRIESADELGEIIRGYLERIVGPCETVAVANAHDAAAAEDLEALLAVDERLHAVTMAAEFRESSTKAGRQLSELVLVEDDRERRSDVDDESESSGDRPLERVYAEAIDSGETPGHYPVVFGVVAAQRGLSRREACLAQAYSFVTGVLGATQRLGRFSHTDIQSILADLLPVITDICERHVDDEIVAMASFAPLTEIMGMRHERAGRRLFMS
ncbi:urease accessory protein UreF [Halostagnicola larsenii XH-48]|uniref:Urease accessory protein UreF n=1 Tax=Halostagnicola larsenii XH-48 TaxID=797299 RepID=W0JPZ1_9EURY|nr:urease accessory UreF family protein [Halostagnicola larsenii]AHF99249.1 urease accessory protein UreF [Halostagnicola larsenii XH-48]